MRCFVIIFLLLKVIFVEKKKSFSVNKIIFSSRLLSLRVHLRNQEKLLLSVLDYLDTLLQRNYLKMDLTTL